MLAQEERDKGYCCCFKHFDCLREISFISLGIYHHGIHANDLNRDFFMMHGDCVGALIRIDTRMREHWPIIDVKSLEASAGCAAPLPNAV